MHLGGGIIILPYGKNLKSYLLFGMTNVTSTDFVAKRTNCTWWEPIHGTRLDNYRLYIFKKYTLWHAGFCRIINAFSSFLKGVDIIFLFNNCNW